MNKKSIKMIEDFTKACRRKGINFVCSFQLPGQKFGIAQSGTKTAVLGHIAKLNQMAINTDAEYYEIGKELWDDIGEDAGKLIESEGGE